MADQSIPTLSSLTVGDEHARRRVVFLHGLFGRGRNFSSMAARLQPEALSLLVDLPNHGASAWTAEFDYDAMVDALAEFLRADFAATGPVDVVGHSMGGKVAMVLALRHPDLVRRLAVLDISPVSKGATPGNFRHLLDSLALVDLGSLTKRVDASVQLQERIADSAVRGFLLQNLRRSDDGFEWEPNLALLRAELDTVMGFPDEGERQFGGPVLWIKGERSDYISDEDAPAMRAYFPRTRRITVKDAGHWVHSEQPEAVGAALRGFLLAED